MIKKTEKPKLAILVNTIAPSRIPLFEYLAASFTLLILTGGNESNRPWAFPSSKQFEVRRVWGGPFKIRKRIGLPGVWDTSYLHLNVGILWCLRQFQPEVIITNEMGFRTLSALVYSSIAKVPMWVWWGGTILSERRISFAKRLLRKIIVTRAKRWISYGQTSTEYLLSCGVLRDNILQVQNCVEQEAFLRPIEATRKWFRDNQNPVILAVGQLIQRKGLHHLVQACGRLSEKGYEFTLVLVGDGPERDLLIELARDCGLNSILILPNQDAVSLNEIYRSADALVFPTIEDVWGLVVNEALWAGLPVLCSRFAGCAEELLPPENIFDPLVPESIDAALLQIFEVKVRPHDPRRLMTWQTVAEMLRTALVQDLLQV